MIPSLPGHGFSGKPTETGWDPIRIARAWVVLMERLGYTRVRRAGRRLGQCRHRADGAAEAPGTAGHPHEHAGDRSARRLEGARRSAVPTPAGLSGRREEGIRDAGPLLRDRRRLRQRDGEPPADALRHRGLTGRPGGLDARSRRAQLRAHRARLRRTARRPLARRRPRQRHPLLADEHGDLLGAPLLGEQAGLLRRQGRRDPGRRDRLPRRALSGSAELGGEGVSQARPLQPRSTRAATSPPGSSRRSSREEIRATFRSLR